MNKLTTMKFLIDLEWLTLWWNWVIRALWTSKYLILLELLGRRATDKRSIGRDAAILPRSNRTTGWAKEGIFVGWALITTGFFTRTDKCILSRWRWLLWNWGVIGILSKMVLDYHVGRNVYFRLRVPVYLCSVTPASALVLVACTSCGVFWNNMKLGLLVTMWYYLLVSLLIIGFGRKYTFIRIPLLSCFFTILVLRPWKSWRCKTRGSMNWFFVVLALVRNICWGSVSTARVRKGRRRRIAIVELILVANYLSWHTGERSLLIGH